MLMAVFFRGLAEGELAVWADAMVHSGDVLDLGAIERPKVDKHSTGGVGDKISLCLAPAVAACGVAVPMISGRGLGHSGGTLDKLEAIPGFRTDLDAERFAALTDSLGTCLIGQTARLAPADRRLYALRDVSATVESVPLIAASIMSKKLAEGIDALVLDCKVGRGAFMKTLENARELAAAIIAIGRAAGKRVQVLLTEMDHPIGRYVGNGNEVIEAIDVMRGQGPADTRELTIRLGAEMLRAADNVASASAIGDSSAEKERDLAAEARIAEALDSGRALEVFRRVVAAQGGDAAVVDDPVAVIMNQGGTAPVAHEQTEIVATADGYVRGVDAFAVGVAVQALGAGRMRKEDAVDPIAGAELMVRVGDPIVGGQTLARLTHRNRVPSAVSRAIALMQGAFEITDEPVSHAGSRIIEVIR